MAEEEDKKPEGFKEDSFSKKLFDKFEKTFGMQAKTSKESLNAVAKLATQVKFTQELINSNRKKIEKVAETDQEAAKFLKDFDSTNFALLDEVKNSLANNEGINQKQSAELLTTFDKIQGGLGNLSLDGLETNMGNVVEQLRGVVNDGSLSRDVQRDFVNDFVSVLGQQKDLGEDQQAALDLLVEQQEQGLNFSQDQVGELNDLLQFFEESKIGNLKEQGTLDDLSRKFSSFLVGQDEIKNSLEENKFDGKSLSDLLKDGLDSDIGIGITDLMLGALGLPGLTSTLKSVGGFATKAKDLITSGFSKIFGKEGFLTKIFGKGGFISKIGTKIKSITGPIGKVFGKAFGGISKVIGKLGGVFKTMGSVFGGVGKIAGPVLKAGKFLKVIPVVGTVIAAISGIFDAVSGFFNASEIAGKPEELLTLGDKIQASISSFISGLTFGLLEVEDVFKWFERAKDAFFADDGIFAIIGNFFSGMIDKVSEFSPLEFIENATNSLIDGIKNFYVGIGNFLLDGVMAMVDKIKALNPINFLPDSIKNLFGDDEEVKVAKEEPKLSNEALNRVGNLFSDQDNSAPPIMSKTSQVTEESDVGTSASVAMSKEVTNDSRQSKPQIITVPASGGDGGPKGVKVPQRRNQIDDMQLSAINIGLMD